MHRRRPSGSRAHRAQKQNLANIIGVMGYPENLLVRHMQSATLLFRDIVKNTTGGRNPFSNIGIRYKALRTMRRSTAMWCALPPIRPPSRPSRPTATSTGGCRCPSVRSIRLTTRRSWWRAVRLSRHRQGGRQQRPPGPGLHRRARPRGAKCARTRRRARRLDAMDRERHQADAAIDRRGLRSAARQP